MSVSGPLADWPEDEPLLRLETGPAGEDLDGRYHAVACPGGYESCRCTMWDSVLDGDEDFDPDGDRYREGWS